MGERSGIRQIVELFLWSLDFAIVFTAAQQVYNEHERCERIKKDGDDDVCECGQWRWSGAEKERESRRIRNEYDNHDDTECDDEAKSMFSNFMPCFNTKLGEKM